MEVEDAPSQGASKYGEGFYPRRIPCAEKFVGDSYSSRRKPVEE